MRQLKNRLSHWWSSQDSHIVDVVRGASIAGVLKILAGALQFGLTVVLDVSLVLKTLESTFSL